MANFYGGNFTTEDAAAQPFLGQQLLARVDLADFFCV